MERSLQRAELVEQDSKRPDVCLVIVRSVVTELRAQVQRRAIHRLHHDCLRPEHTPNTKIADLWVVK
eukprot:196093-Hanusia_phi.AAC.1